MSKQEFWLIVAFLIARLVGMIIMAVLTTVLVFNLVDNLGEDTNDALTALLGVTMAAIATGATILANALGRDITEHLERMRHRAE